MKPKTNSEKLRALADWFEKYDLTIGRIGQDEVQKDLRAMADEFEQLQQGVVVRPAKDSSDGGELLGNADAKGVRVGLWSSGERTTG